MTRELALKIMRVSQNYTKAELKSKYHSLMILTHPDAASEHDYPYEASDINVAYEYLLKHIGEKIDANSQKASRKKSPIKWNAPVNEAAYAPRDIYHNVEDEDGNVIGKAIIDSGKYIWIEDEDFSSFLSSLYNCSKSIISMHDETKDFDRSSDITLLSKLTYLLIQQFVDTSMILGLLTKADSNNIYEVDAMLEITNPYVRLTDGATIYPARISEHRLYVKSQTGKEIGYLSFKDDRLYYGIIPIFERRACKIKMQVACATCKYLNHKKYVDVNLMLKLLDEDMTCVIESINAKIDKLLNE